jgi:hypothetical protein
MNTIEIQKARSIRFRRWSRAGYAVFCSLACSVTIGCVAIPISDKSLQKYIGATSTVRVIAAETDPVYLEVVLQQVQETTFIQTKFDNATACGQTSSYIFIHHSG